MHDVSDHLSHSEPLLSPRCVLVGLIVTVKKLKSKRKMFSDTYKQLLTQRNSTEKENSSHLHFVFQERCLQCPQVKQHSPSVNLGPCPGANICSWGLSVHSDSVSLDEVGAD